MASISVDVNHHMHNSGSIEAPNMASQVTDRERLDQFIALLHRAASEAGFVIQECELLESFRFHRGHLPELHIVAVQLPAESYLTDQLLEVVHKRERQGGR